MSREAERKRLIELIRETDCVDIWNHYTDDYKEPNPIEELADYLLENGVIVAPCKIGQTVYRIYTNSWIGEDKVIGFWAIESGLRYYDDKGRETSCDKFGKLVFLSEAEAKYALKNRRSVSLVNGHIEE